MSQRVRTPQIREELRRIRKDEKRAKKREAIEEGRKVYLQKEYRRAERKAEREAARRERREANVGQ